MTTSIFEYLLCTESSPWGESRGQTEGTLIVVPIREIIRNRCDSVEAATGICYFGCRLSPIFPPAYFFFDSSSPQSDHSEPATSYITSSLEWRVRKVRRRMLLA